MSKKIKSLVLYFAVILLVFSLTACKKEPELELVTGPCLFLEEDTAYLEYGGSYEIKYESTEKTEFSTTDEEVAVVSSNGKVYAVGVGECDIVIKAAYDIKHCHITVDVKRPESISFQESENRVEIGSSLSLKLNETDVPDLSFESSDESILTVDKNGVITGISLGKAEVKAKSYNQNREEIYCAIDIEVFSPVPEYIDCGYKFKSMNPGQSFDFIPSVYPKGSSRENESWVSSDESVVTVNNGRVSAVAEGICKVTYSVDGSEKTLSYTIVVSVTEKNIPALKAGMPNGRYVKQNGVFTNGKESDTARLMFVGDLMCLSAQQSGARKGESFDFCPSFELVKPIFEQSDLLIGNLETCVSYSYPTTYQQKLDGTLPRCNAPVEYLDALKYAGFDGVATANNHCCDTFELGAYETIGLLDEYGFAHTGTFMTEEDKRYMLFDVNGIKVAVLSYTEFFNGKQSRIEDKNLVLNEYGKDKVTKDIADAKADGAEFVVVYNHWGTENTTSLSTAQKNHAKGIANAGADLIIGSHPHVLQGNTYIITDDGRTVPCYYSLGNFVSSMGSTANNDTVIVDISIKRTENGIEITDSGYIPAVVKGSNRTVTPVDVGSNNRIESVFKFD